MRHMHISVVCRSFLLVRRARFVGLARAGERVMLQLGLGLGLGLGLEPGAGWQLMARLGLGSGSGSASGLEHLWLRGASITNDP